MDLFIATQVLKEVLTEQASASETSQEAEKAAKLIINGVEADLSPLGAVMYCKQKPDNQMTLDTVVYGRRKKETIDVCEGYPYMYVNSYSSNWYTVMAFHSVAFGFWVYPRQPNVSQPIQFNLQFSKDTLFEIIIENKRYKPEDLVDPSSIIRKFGDYRAIVKTDTVAKTFPKNEGIDPYMKIFPFGDAETGDMTPKAELYPVDEMLKDNYPAGITVDQCDCNNGSCSQITKLTSDDVYPGKAFTWINNVDPPFTQTVAFLDSAILLTSFTGRARNGNNRYHSRTLCVTLPTTTPAVVIPLYSNTHIVLDSNAPCQYAYLPNFPNTGELRYLPERGQTPEVFGKNNFEAVFARKICVSAGRYDTWNTQAFGGALVIPLRLKQTV